MIDPSEKRSSVPDVNPAAAACAENKSPLAASLAPMLARDLLPLLEELAEARSGVPQDEASSARS